MPRFNSGFNPGSPQGIRRALSYNQIMNRGGRAKSLQQGFPTRREVGVLVKDYFDAIEGYYKQANEHYSMNDQNMQRLHYLMGGGGASQAAFDRVFDLHKETWSEIWQMENNFRSNPLLMNNNPDKALTKEEVAQIKSQYKALRKKISKLIKKEGKQVDKIFKEEISAHKGMYDKKQTKEIRSLAKKIFGVKNLSQQLHNLFSQRRNGVDAIWRPNYKKIIPFEFGGRPSYSMARMESLNRGLTSYSVRNTECRGRDGVELINFHRTSYDFTDAQGHSRFPAFSATRSGSLCEMDESDAQTRRNSNIKMAEELLSHKAFEGATGDEIRNNSSRNPLELDFQSVCLLSYYPKSVRGQRYEYQQFKDQKEALESFSGRAVEYRDPRDLSKTIWVKFNVRVWSMGNAEDAFGRFVINSNTRAKIPGMQMLQNIFQDRHNDKAMDNLKKKYESSLAALERVKKPKKSRLTPAQQRDHAKLIILRKEKAKIRKEIASMEQTSTYIKKALSIVSWIPVLGNLLERGVDDARRESIDDLYKEYQNRADQMVKIFNTYNNGEGDGIFYLEKQEEDIRDLFYDVEELYGAKVYHYLWQTRDDRYALPATLNVLSFKLSQLSLGGSSREVTPHFNCKSGCDRTGGLDVASKRKVELARLHGRFLSYRELAHVDNSNDNLNYEDQVGTQLRLHSGNYDYISEKRFGVRGLKNKNNRGLRHSNPEVEDLLYRVEQSSALIFGM